MPKKQKTPRPAPPAGALRLYDRHQLEALLPLSYPHVWVMMRQGKFPLPFTLGDQPRSRVVWLADEVDAWILARPRRTYTKKTTEAA